MLDELVQLLLANETVDGSEVYALAGRPEPAAAGAGMTMAPDRASSVKPEPVSKGSAKAVPDHRS